jgi:putative ABC transport system substrate-binding protein
MQFDGLKRRNFITLLGGAAAAWPLTARAQQPERMRRIGVLMGVADDAEGQARVKALEQGLQELGWIEGRNVRIDYRWTGGDATRIRTYAAELVKLSPDVIVAHTPPVIAAMRQASNSIPIVFAGVIDPEAHGFIDNLARPGGKGRQARRSACGSTGQVRVGHQSKDCHRPRPRRTR